MALSVGCNIWALPGLASAIADLGTALDTVPPVDLVLPLLHCFSVVYSSFFPHSVKHI